jgi:hypothetical protein
MDNFKHMQLLQLLRLRPKNGDSTVLNDKVTVNNTTESKWSQQVAMVYPKN